MLILNVQNGSWIKLSSKHHVSYWSNIVCDFKKLKKFAAASKNRKKSRKEHIFNFKNFNSEWNVKYDIQR